MQQFFQDESEKILKTVSFNLTLEAGDKMWDNC